jgi:hypothetical protein
MAKETTEKKLYDLLSTRDYDNFQALDSRTGKVPVDPETGAQDVGQADMFVFDWSSSRGKNYGTAVILLTAEHELELYFGDNLGKTMEDTEDKNEWFDFMEQLRHFATRTNFNGFRPLNINQLRHSLQGQAAIRESLFESWQGRKNLSWSAGPTEARLMIRHKRNLDETDARHLYIESLFIETEEGERYKLPFTKLAGGRAMLEHVRQGGRPYDMRGQHIAGMVQELNVLGRFERTVARDVILEGDTAQLVSEAAVYRKTLKENLKRLGTARGYAQYFESWNPVDLSEQDVVIESLKHMFVKQTLDARIEQALPVLARIQQQGNAMKEAAIFEAWATRLVEGTWSTPDTPEAQKKLLDFMSRERPVGADAFNATEQLYDILGDDQLFDQLETLAQENPNADCRQLVLDRMQELSDNPDVRAVLEQLNIDADATMTPPESLPADLGDQEQGVAEGVTPGLQPDGKYYNKAGRLIGTWDGRTLTIDPAANKYWTDEFGEEEAKKIAMRWQSQLQKNHAPSEDSIRYYANELEKYDIQSNLPRQSRQHYYDLAVQMLSGQKGVAEGNFPGAKDVKMPGKENNYNKYHSQLKALADSGKINTPQGKQIADKLITAIEKEFPNEIAPSRSVWLSEQGMAGPDSPGLKFINPDVKEDAVKALRRAAGLTENVLRDSTGSTLDHIADTFKRDIRDFEETGNLSEELYDALYDYYQDDMPYGTKKARSGDPYEWIADRITQDLGLESSNLGPFDQFKARNTAARDRAGMEPNPDFQEERDPPSVDGGMANDLLQDNIAGRVAGSIAGAELGPMGSALGGAIGDELTDEAVCNMSEAGESCPVHGMDECWGSTPMVGMEQTDPDHNLPYHPDDSEGGSIDEEGFGLNPTPSAMEEKSPLAGIYGHSGRMKEVGRDTSWLDRLRELSGMSRS